MNNPGFWVNCLALIGRVLISAIFLFAAFAKIVTFPALSASMTALGIPESNFVLGAAIVWEGLGGLLVLFGWYARFGAFLLFLLILPFGFLMHYWSYQGDLFWEHLPQILGDLIPIVGGTLYVMAFGAGRYSIDGFRHRKDLQH